HLRSLVVLRRGLNLPKLGFFTLARVFSRLFLSTQTVVFCACDAGIGWRSLKKQKAGQNSRTFLRQAW
ncbi:MAG TPA: hypothetical protein VFI95_06945, partial [Terriglobales bacterium]|nr:hypothetical protein [Terriglobales bacterium]